MAPARFVFAVLLPVFIACQACGIESRGDTTYHAGMLDKWPVDNSGVFIKRAPVAFRLGKIEWSLPDEARATGFVTFDASGAGLPPDSRWTAERNASLERRLNSRKR